MDEEYHEYGEQKVQERLQEARKHHALRELEKLGYTISLDEAKSA